MGVRTVFGCSSKRQLKATRPHVIIGIMRSPETIEIARIPTGSRSIDEAIWINIRGLAVAAEQVMLCAIARRSNLPVGAAVRAGIEGFAGGFAGAQHLSNEALTFVGANFEVRWQNSYHAEEVAILKMLLVGCRKIRGIVVSAERELFTPCGKCLDLLKEFGTSDCLVAHFRPSTDKLSVFTLDEIAPFYPVGENGRG